MEEKKQYLLKGDISGIQEFIFNVQSKGAAKTLKAKSYYIQVLSKLASDLIVERLPESKLFCDGGGTFFIEFYATDNLNAKSEIDRLQKELNESQIKEDLLIHLSFVDTATRDFWTNLRAKSNQEKLKPFNADIDFFTPFERVKETKDGRFPQVESWIETLTQLDNRNNSFKLLTDIMVKQSDIVVKMLNGEFTKRDAEFDSSLINKLPFYVDYEEFSDYEKYRDKHKELYASDDRLNGENIVDFDALGDFAAHRTGTNKIGILKLDVDNLGKLFGSADYNNVKNYSKTFSTFFTNTIFTRLYNTKSFGLLGSKKAPYKANIYPIFSGGDDCFIIGGWDAILCFTIELHDLFSKDEEISKLTLNGKPISFSAGIVLVDPTHPVRNFSELAESALSKAKANGKDKISIFGLTFSWEDYKQILDISKVVADEMEERNISRAYLDKIRKSAKGFNALQNRNGADFDKIYKLKYYLSKNEDKLGNVVKALFNPYYESLKDRLIGGNTNKYDVAIYPAITRVAEFLTKPKLDYGQ